MLLEIERNSEDNAGILTLNGVLDVSTVEIFKNEMENLKNVQEVKIDFAGIRFIDSTGIGGLAQVIKKLQEKKVDIKVKNISKDVYEILDILGLPEIFGEEIFEVKLS